MSNGDCSKNQTRVSVEWQRLLPNSTVVFSTGEVELPAIWRGVVSSSLHRMPVRGVLAQLLSSAINTPPVAALSTEASSG